MINKNIHTPEGLRDIYGSENDIKLKVQRDILDSIQSFGYRNIQTPTFEFIEVYGKEVGSTPSNELYKFFDKEGNILALRPDFTPSIARCATKYYNNECAPIRFYYTGNTFTNTINLQGRLNEMTQIGAELIGDDSIYADAEMIYVAVMSLLAAGLRDFQISISNVDYFRGICEEVGLDNETKDEVFTYLSKQNYFAAEELLSNKGIAEDKYQKILTMSQLMGGQNALIRARENVTNSISISAIEKLEKIYELLTVYKIDKYVSFDFSMISKYKYYSGVIFKGYTYGIGEAIVTGGRYDKLMEQFGNDTSAIGFMYVVDDLLEAMRSQRIEVALNEKNAAIFFEEESFTKAVLKQEELRKNNVNVTMIFKQDKVDIEEYRKKHNNVEIYEL